MNPTQHVLLARALIDANGGVDACCKPVTRVERSQLYAYRDFNSGVFMPADVIDALESRSKNPVYSQFLFSQVQAEPQTACVVQEAADVDEAGNDVWRFLRKAAAEGRPLSESERREAERLLQRVDQEMAELRAVLHQGAGT
ncbi:MAG: hypothetical protein IE910_05835 [Brevundimonas sp.]|nr:hypothetical protein [Brevundimonas sp.]